MQSAGSAGEFYTPRAVTDFMSRIIQPKIGETMADFACGTGGFITSWLKVLEPQMKTVEDREAFDKSVYGIEKKQFPYMLCVTNLLLHNIDTPKIYHDNSLLKDVLDYTDDDQFDVILMIIWSTKLYINILLFISFLNRKHSYLLKNVKIA